MRLAREGLLPRKTCAPFLHKALLADPQPYRPVKCDALSALLRRNCVLLRRLRRSHRVLAIISMAPLADAFARLLIRYLVSGPATVDAAVAQAVDEAVVDGTVAAP